MGTQGKTARLNYRLEGPAGAPVIVFGPSLGTDLGLFEPQATALSGDFQILRHDLRGHGASEVPEGPYTIGEMADDVIGLLDDLGIDRFSYVGVSIGGAIAQWLGVHHGHRLDALVICASAAQFYDPPSWPQRAARVRSEGTDFLIESRYGAWFTPEWAEGSPEGAERLLNMLGNTPREGYAGCCEAIAAYDLRDRLGEITTPTLVIAGEEDPATPVATVSAIAEGIPGAKLLVVPDSSHLVNFEKPEVVSAAIAKHIGAVRIAG